MTQLEQIMLQALQDMQKSFRDDLDASEFSFNQALTDLENGYTQQVQRWERELAAFVKAQQSLQSMFTQVSAENVRLSAQVTSLTKLVTHLAEQVQQLK